VSVTHRLRRHASASPAPWKGAFTSLWTSTNALLHGFGRLVAKSVRARNPGDVEPKPPIRCVQRPRSATQSTTLGEHTARRQLTAAHRQERKSARGALSVIHNATAWHRVRRMVGQNPVPVRPHGCADRESDISPDCKGNRQRGTVRDVSVTRPRDVALSASPAPSRRGPLRL